VKSPPPQWHEPLARQNLGNQPMRITYVSANGRLRIEMEAGSPKQVFELVAGVQDLFDEPECGLCKSKSIGCDVREFGGNKYYKMLCYACGATLDFGQHKDGKGLFSKRWHKDTNQPLPNRGWYQYKG
jgi:hypothetical protein